jgi:3-deoxy-manno-octulosonate cytidylyltransferase (CMP-KDO synthetase)
MNNKRVVAIIPARMAASRFPGKPLTKIMDLPMIEHVRRRTLLSPIIDEAYVATCDEEIMETVQRFGGKAIMTANTHERCTDRVEEAAKQVKADIIAIVQGDEPLFLPDVIEKLVKPIQSDNDVYCTNLLSVIKDYDDLKNIDIVKAVIDNYNNVMYFSRSSIPYFRVKTDYTMYRQTGISAFTKKFLSKFTKMAPTSLEKIESIDFLRILQHGYKIRGVAFHKEMFGVDRKEDVKKIEEIIQNDPTQNGYYKRIVKS